METEQEIFEERTEEHVRKEVFDQEKTGDNIINFAPKQTPPLDFLEKVIVTILLGLVFLMPIFFLPSSGISSAFSKNILLFAIVVSALTLTFALWLKRGTITFPKNPIFAAVFFLASVSVFSSFLSGSFSNSFFGLGWEITTSLALLELCLLLFLFAIFFRTKERLFYAFVALVISSLIVFLFQISQFIFPNLTDFAWFSANKTANLIGSWIDFGIFSGIITVLSLVTLEKLPHIGKGARGMLYFFLITALFFHSMVFYSSSWAILGVIALVISAMNFVGRTNRTSAENVLIIKKRILSPSFFVVILSFFLIFAGQSVNVKLFELFNMPPIQDVKPSWSGTYHVSRGLFADKSSILNKEVFFGVGPNRFFIPWQKYRPKEVNYTPWWSVDFNEGVGTIPSALISSGIFGFLAWISFLFLFFFGGLRALRKGLKKTSAFVQYAAAASFVAALYCWVVIFLNTVGAVPFTFAFVFTGLFLGALSAGGVPQVRDYHYSQNPKIGFVLAGVLLLLIGVSLFLGYHIIERTRSFFAYRDARLSRDIGDLEKAGTEFKKAVLLAPNDAYYRSFSDFNSYWIEQLILRTDISPDEIRSQFKANFQTSIENANHAIVLDSANYQNWLALGNAYATLVPLGIKNISDQSYTQAKIAYEQAAILSPFNPQIPYLLTKLALSKNQPDEARNYAKRVLDLKNDYTDASILLSLTEESQGRLNEALAIMERASVTNSSDPAIIFRLGYLRYKNGNYGEAVTTLEKAVKAVPDYANAKYFLGLSYFEFGRIGDAVKEFTDIEGLNPGRADIAQIISNLQGGYAPLSAPQFAPVSGNASTTAKKPVVPAKKR